MINNKAEFFQVDTSWKHYNKKAKSALVELEENHQHSVLQEIFNRNKDKLNKTALFNRVISISYGTLFEKVNQYTNCLLKLGYKKGDEIPVCMKMSPEFIYIFLAISRIGAVMNSVGEWFDKDYLIDILNSTESKYFFITSNYYEDVRQVFELSTVKKIISFDLDISLRGEKSHFKEYDSPFLDLHYSAPKTDFVMDCTQFLSLADVDDRIEDSNFDIRLDDTFTITYKSGTTNPERPKAIAHAVRSYMTISRFKDPDISGLGTMKNLVALAHFPAYVHAGLTTSITDPLFRSCCIALEPIYEKNYFIHALMLNKPNFVCASVGFWGDVAKKLLFEPQYKNVTMPYLFVATVSGEGMNKGEERFFNKVAKLHKFGVDKLPFPLSPIKFTIGGGTSESSGVLVTLYKALQENRPYYAWSKRSIGLIPLGCCRVKTVNKKGTDCKVYEVGEIVLSGPCTMKGYHYQTNLNQQTYIMDDEGVIWLKTGAYGSIDKRGTVKIHGRMVDKICMNGGEEYPFYKIEEALEVIKVLLSCTVVTQGQNIIVHIESRPDMRVDKDEFVGEVAKRIKTICPEEIIDKIYIRYRDNVESFPVAPSGKRDRKKLIDEGVKCAVAMKEIKY